MTMIGGYAFWLLLLVILWVLFGGCGRGLWRGGGCGPRWYGGAGPENPPGPPAETPKQILDRRLARGEVTLEEYRRILQELGNESHQ